MMQDDDDNDDPMILNIRAKNHTSERTIVPWTVIFAVWLLLMQSVFSDATQCLANAWFNAMVDEMQCTQCLF